MYIYIHITVTCRFINSKSQQKHTHKIGRRKKGGGGRGWSFIWCLYCNTVLSFWLVASVFQSSVLCSRKIMTILILWWQKRHLYSGIYEIFLYTPVHEVCWTFKLDNHSRIIQSSTKIHTFTSLRKRVLWTKKFLENLLYCIHILYTFFTQLQWLVAFISNYS